MHICLLTFGRETLSCPVLVIRSCYHKKPLSQLAQHQRQSRETELFLEEVCPSLHGAMGEVCSPITLVLAVQWINKGIQSLQLQAQHLSLPHIIHSKKKTIVESSRSLMLLFDLFIGTRF